MIFKFQMNPINSKVNANELNLKFLIWFKVPNFSKEAAEVSNSFDFQFTTNEKALWSFSSGEEFLSLKTFEASPISPASDTPRALGESFI